jgi:hypothetical protein
MFIISDKYANYLFRKILFCQSYSVLKRTRTSRGSSVMNESTHILYSCPRRHGPKLCSGKNKVFPYRVNLYLCHWRCQIIEFQGLDKALAPGPGAVVQGRA